MKKLNERARRRIRWKNEELETYRAAQRINAELAAMDSRDDKPRPLHQGSVRHRITRGLRLAKALAKRYAKMAEEMGADFVVQSVADLQEAIVCFNQARQEAIRYRELPNVWSGRTQTGASILMAQYEEQQVYARTAATAVAYLTQAESIVGAMRKAYMVSPDLNGMLNGRLCDEG